MASHVSTCMSMEKSIKGEGNQFVEEESNKNVTPGIITIAKYYFFPKIKR